MMMTHVSDWHGKTVRLTSTDVCVVSGDMLPNFPMLRVLTKLNPNNVQIVTREPSDLLTGKVRGQVVGNEFIRSRELVKQAEWCMQHPFRRETGLSDDVPVIVCRGNHDYVDLAGWIGGDVWEVTEDAMRTTRLFGLKFGGIRGINFINGQFSDELSIDAFNMRAGFLPLDIDVLVTHAPPVSILDYEGEHWGSSALRRYVDKRGYSEKCLLMHTFGHVHENCGTLKEYGTTFSNAATTVNQFEITKEGVECLTRKQ